MFDYEASFEGGFLVPVQGGLGVVVWAFEGEVSGDEGCVWKKLGVALVEDVYEWILSLGGLYAYEADFPVV